MNTTHIEIIPINDRLFELANALFPNVRKYQDIYTAAAASEKTEILISTIPAMLLIYSF